MTTDERMRRLENELGRVRRHSRRLVAIGTVVLLLMGAVVWMGVTTATGDDDWEDDDSESDVYFRTVKARGIAVVDNKGKSRIVLAAPRGNAQLIMLDEAGTPRATLSVHEDNPALTLSGGKSGPVLVLRVDEHGPAIVMTDEKSNTIWQAPPPDDTPEEAEAGEE